MTRIALAALAALGCTAVPAGATAIQIHGDRAFVAYQDLNLASDQGRDTLLRRIKTAAYRVCNPEEFNSYSQPDRQCVRVAVAGGLAQMDAILPVSAKS